MPFGPPTHPVGCNYTFSYQGLCCESVVAISTLSVLALGSEELLITTPPPPPKHDSSLKCTPDHVRDMVSTWTLQLHVANFLMQGSPAWLKVKTHSECNN